MVQCTKHQLAYPQDVKWSELVLPEIRQNALLLSGKFCSLTTQIDHKLSNYLKSPWNSSPQSHILNCHLLRQNANVWQGRSEQTIRFRLAQNVNFHRRYNRSPDVIQKPNRWNNTFTSSSIRWNNKIKRHNLRTVSGMPWFGSKSIINVSFCILTKSCVIIFFNDNNQII